MEKAIEASLWGMFVGDALSVARHWYYDSAVLKQHYPPQEFAEKEDCKLDYTAIDASLPHPDSWKYFSKIDPAQEPIDLFHEKAARYKDPGMHYHLGLQPGEPSINAQIVGLLVKYLIESGEKNGYDLEEFFSGPFVELFSKPGMHNDTYIDGAVRTFFRKYAANGNKFPVRDFDLL
jgi:hypothetical protein